MAEGRALPFDGPRLVLLEETRTVYSSSPCAAAPAHCTARWRRYAHRVTALPAWRFGLAALRFRSRRRMCACTLYYPNLSVSSVGVCGSVISRIRRSRHRKNRFRQPLSTALSIRSPSPGACVRLRLRKHPARQPEDTLARLCCPGACCRVHGLEHDILFGCSRRRRRLVYWLAPDWRLQLLRQPARAGLRQAVHPTPSFG